MAKRSLKSSSSINEPVNNHFMEEQRMKKTNFLKKAVMVTSAMVLAAAISVACSNAAVDTNPFEYSEDLVLTLDEADQHAIQTQSVEADGLVDSEEAIPVTKHEGKVLNTIPIKVEKTETVSKDSSKETAEDSKKAAKENTEVTADTTKDVYPAPIQISQVQPVPETEPAILEVIPVEESEESFEEETSQGSDEEPASGQATEHVHTWVTETIHHDEETHEETVTETVHYDAVTESEYVPVIVCECGGRFDDGKEFDEHECDTCQWSCLDWEKRTVEVSPARDEEVTKTVTITDHGAWDEVITKCSGCGQCK